jgi:hypothetical protein
MSCPVNSVTYDALKKRPLRAYAREDSNARHHAEEILRQSLGWQRPRDRAISLAGSDASLKERLDAEENFSDDLTPHLHSRSSALTRAESHLMGIRVIYEHHRA